jgi:deoxyribonuclease V
MTKAAASRRLSSSHSALAHAWPKDVRAARVVQEALGQQVVARNKFKNIRSVAGIDVGYEGNPRRARAAIVVLSFPGLRLLEAVIARERVSFPYVPGFLSFRELPVVFKALAKLKTKVDLFLCDGQGLAHPRRFGLACHLGVLTGTPCVGVAKSRLIGKHGTLASAKGSWVPLRDHGQTVGAVLRTRAGTKPLYVSVGHRVGLKSAIKFVLACTARYRLPETTRRAHRLASESLDLSRLLPEGKN